MSSTFSTTLMILTTAPTFIGVFVSPAARSTVPKMMLAVRGSIGRYKMKKYAAAIDRICSSTCIHTGILPLKPSVTPVKNRPTTSTVNTA